MPRHILTQSEVSSLHINKEYESIAKNELQTTTQPGKNSPTKPTISNSVQRKQQNRTFPDAIRNHYLGSVAFSHHMFSKKVRETEEQNSETHCKHQSIKTKNKQNINNFAMGATN